MFEQIESGRDLSDSGTVAILLGLSPCADTLVLLDAVDASALEERDLVAVLVLWERHRSWMDARLQRALVNVGGPAPQRAEEDDWARDEVACALRLSSTTAGSRLDVARELCGRLSRTGGALEAGVIGYWHAQSMASTLASHPDDVAHAVQHEVLKGGHADETLANFRKRLQRAVIAADPATADERHNSALRTRGVAIYPTEHGMSQIVATLTAAEAATTMCAITAIAHTRRAAGDAALIDQLRADAFSAVFGAALASPDLAAAQGARPSVGVTIDFATLIGLADHPGNLDGYGAIAPAVVRRLAADGDWHRMVTDPVTGALLDYGRKVYRPPAELVDFIVARDQTCRFPGCCRPARLSDIDHAQAWDDGGATSAANGGALCRRHHRLKTARRIILVSHPDGSATWRTKTGHVYERPAVNHNPEHTAHLAAVGVGVGASEPSESEDSGYGSPESGDSDYGHSEAEDTHSGLPDLGDWGADPPDGDDTRSVPRRESPPTGGAGSGTDSNDDAAGGVGHDPTPF